MGERVREEQKIGQKHFVKNESGSITFGKVSLNLKNCHYHITMLLWHTWASSLATTAL